MSKDDLQICLVPRPHYSARPMRIGSRGLSDLRHRNALTEKEGKTPHREVQNVARKAETKIIYGKYGSFLNIF